MTRKILLTLLALTALATALTANDRPDPAGFQGIVVDAGGAIPGKTATSFQLSVTEFGTDEEAGALVKILAEQGQSALLSHLQKEKMNSGWIRLPGAGQPSYTIRFARSFDTEDGRVVRAFTDRPIAIWESFRGYRSADRPFSIIELRLDKDGEGEGTLIAIAELHFDESGNMQITSQGAQPFRLLKVRPMKVKSK